MSKRHFSNQRISKNDGFSLIETLVVFGILSIAMAAISSMMINMHKETKALSESLAALNLQQTLTLALANGNVCAYILNNPATLTFDATLVSTTPQVITPTLPIYASVKTDPPVVLGPEIAKVGTAFSAYANSLVISSIKLIIDGAPTPLPPPGPSTIFSGHWQIEFDPTKSVRIVRPVNITTILSVDTSNPNSAKIDSCTNNQSMKGGYNLINGVCTNKNPLTGSCSCPTGSSAYTIFQWAASGVTEFGYYCM